MLVPLASVLSRTCASALQHCFWPWGEGVERSSLTLLKLYSTDSTCLLSELLLSSGCEGDHSAKGKQRHSKAPAHSHTALACCHLNNLQPACGGKAQGHTTATCSQYGPSKGAKSPPRLDVSSTEHQPSPSSAPHSVEPHLRMRQLAEMLVTQLASLHQPLTAAGPPPVPPPAFAQLHIEDNTERAGSAHMGGHPALAPAQDTNLHSSRLALQSFMQCIS